MVPFFTSVNVVVGMACLAPIILALWLTNVFHTSYLPIVSTKTWDRFGEGYNISRIIDVHGRFDPHGYEQYSPAYMAASHVMMYTMWFALYASTISFAFLYHRHEMKMAILSLYRSLPWVKSEDDESHYQDVHNKLMRSYKEGTHSQKPCADGTREHTPPRPITRANVLDL